MASSALNFQLQVQHQVANDVGLKFQLRSSINLQLTESSLYTVIGFALKGHPKLGFGMDFGGQGQRYLVATL